jgi:hypothetical protein
VAVARSAATTDRESPMKGSRAVGMAPAIVTMVTSIDRPDDKPVRDAGRPDDLQLR